MTSIRDIILKSSDTMYYIILGNITDDVKQKMFINIQYKIIDQLPQMDMFHGILNRYGRVYIR